MEMNWGTLAQNRHLAYRLLSICFSPPSAELLEMLKNGLLALETAPPPLDVLAQDYNRLFYGPGRLLAPPYESIYRENRVMGETTMAVARCYAEAGVSASEEFRNLPDHVAAELEFMACLCAAEEEALKNGGEESATGALRRQHRFLAGHLCRWLPLFAARIASAPGSGIYRELAGLAAEFVEADRDRTEGLLRAVEDSPLQPAEER
ncbi:MAG: molecular chaperone TorD family protein [Euryarchaeota archaeon]|nr:molecular chaperone TorD family protein [Euryarchaeota archaeon]